MTPRPGISSSKSRPRSGQGSVPARGGTGRPTFPSLLSLCPGGHPVTQHIHSPGLTHSQAPEALRAQLSERHPRGSWEDQREAVRKAAWGLGPGGLGALSRCASLLSRELTTQVPACAWRPHPLCLPISPMAPSPEARAGHRQARAHVSADGNQNPDSSGTQATQTSSSSKGLVQHMGSSTQTFLARPRHAGRQVRSCWMGTGQGGACPEKAGLLPSSVPEAWTQWGSGVWADKAVHPGEQGVLGLP